jgi:predicted nucleic acid-binding protein
MIFLDTNILIEIFKGNSVVIRAVQNLDPNSLALSAITEMELYCGALNKLELQRIKKSLRHFNICHLTTGISISAITLIEKYSKSHNIQIPDALIAATAMENGSELMTLNRKDFQYIDALLLHNLPK